MVILPVTVFKSLKYGKQQMVEVAGTVLLIRLTQRHCPMNMEYQILMPYMRKKFGLVPLPGACILHQTAESGLPIQLVYTAGLTGLHSEILCLAWVGVFKTQ